MVPLSVLVVEPMDKQDVSTPIINIMSNNGGMHLSTEYLADQMLLVNKRSQAKLSSKEFHKLKLGKQKYCWTGFIRHWVWEGNDWRVYVSNNGAAFEVKDGIDMVRAWAAWKDYFSRF